MTSVWIRVPKSPGASADRSSITMPRSRASGIALTRLTCCSRADSISPAAKLAVISLVFLCATSPR